MKFKLIKCIYYPEHYVTFNLSRAQRSFCAQTRCGILPLAVETRRFHSVSEKNRKRHRGDLSEAETCCSAVHLVTILDISVSLTCLEKYQYRLSAIK